MNFFNIFLGVFGVPRDPSFPGLTKMVDILALEISKLNVVGKSEFDGAGGLTIIGACSSDHATKK
jgi:hypothetical protein